MASFGVGVGDFSFATLFSANSLEVEVRTEALLRAHTHTILSHMFSFASQTYPCRANPPKNFKAWILKLHK